MEKSYLQKINEQVVEAQQKYGYNKEMKQVLEVFEPGQSGFMPRKGYILLNIVSVNVRQIQFEGQKLILGDEATSTNKSKQISASDYMGINPHVFVVAEVGPDSSYKPGDLVYVDSYQNRSMYEHCVTIKNSYGFNVPESFITGSIDKL